MRTSQQIALVLGFLLVFFQIFGVNLTNFISLEDDILTEQEEERQHHYSRRQNVVSEDESYALEEELALEEGTTTDNLARNPSGSQQGPLKCNQHNECCASWDIDADDWWTQHPDWEVSRETSEEYCFQPIRDPNRTQFIRRVHEFQWRGDNCDQLMKSIELNSGYGASTAWLTNVFYRAYVLESRPFDIALNQRDWIYAVKDPEHPLYCPAMDSRCYYLPVSGCPNRTETIKDEHYGLKKVYRETMEYYWLRQYLYRPNQTFRKLLLELRQSIHLQLPCTAMHVRRADVGFPRQPFRRYAAVQEYIDRVPNLKQGDSIFVMTDDQSTIDEIQKYLRDDYQWTYLDRERNRGIKGGWENHIPSKNEAYEMLVMHTEWDLARQCNQIVYGESGFMNNFVKEMEWQGRTDYETFVLNVNLRQWEVRQWNLQPRARVDYFFQDIAKYYADRGMVAKNVLTTWKGDLLPPTEVEINGTEKLVTCTSNPEECCGTWDINADAWWLHKPDWEVSMENETHFCFTPLQNKTQREFLRNLHEFQWGGDCSNVAKTVVVNSGFASSISWEVLTFFYALRNQQQYQLIDHGRHWLYAPHDKNSWAYCESADSRCYYLPVGRCSRKETIPGEHHDERYKRGEKEIWQLLKKYSTRPNQEFRRRVFEMKKKINLQQPCTTIHVRRGDSGVPTTPYRRYAAVQEYLDAGNVEEGSTVFLMTDDDSTLAEVQKYLSDKFNWVYFERARNKGVDAGFDMHIASGDEALEMVAIASEQELASGCQKFVHGLSGFSKSLVEDMEFAHKNISVYYLDTEVPKEEAVPYRGNKEGRAAKFLEDIEEFYQRRTKAEAESITTKKLSEAAKESPGTDDKVVNPKEQSDATTHLATDTMNIAPVKCENTPEGRRCCAGWDNNMDSWWIDHPTWEIATLNETIQCFKPTLNVEKAEYLMRVYRNQWHGNCEQVVTSTQINSGYSASTNFLAYTFLNATIEGRPFEITRHDFPWLFGPTAKDSWAYCSAEDITCYILPLSRCERDFVPQSKLRFHVKNKRVTATPKTTQKDKIEFAWLKQYMMRPNQETRRHLMLMLQQFKLTTPCTMIHVRRSDAGYPEQPYRRYAAVQEYLDAGEVQEGETILLLTDDQTTIDEINTYHQNYNWVYVNRTRNNGIYDGKWQGHVPSGDPAFEVLVIEAETYLAGKCSKIVYGSSGFMKYVLSQMGADGKTFESHFVNTAVSKDVARNQWPMDKKERMEFFFKEMEEYRKRSKEAKQQESGADTELEDGSTPDAESEVDNSGPMEKKKEGSIGGNANQAVEVDDVIIDDSLMICEGEGEEQECCASWDINVDKWWTHKPTWEVSKETDTLQCFAPMKDPEKVEYVQRVYDIQWKSDCSGLLTSTQINSGYGAGTNWLAKVFLRATTDGLPFQIALHDIPWLYGPTNNSSWAYCESEDITCFILPLSKCDREFVPKGRTTRNYPRKDKEPDRFDPKGGLQFQWLREFMLRPNQKFRWEKFNMRKSVNLTQPCTTMHVRRGDAGLPRIPYRRYAAVQEYLDVGEVEEGDTILLLTDDQTTIDEIHKYHKDYKWVYVNRTRTYGVDSGWESHIPSGDGPFEVLVIETETYLAGLCEKIIHGKSGFMKVVRGTMEREGKQYRAFVLDTSVKKEEAIKWTWDGKERMEYFMKEMDEYRKKSAENKKKKQQEEKEDEEATLTE